MASVKVLFRPSSVAGCEGSVYYQLIHNRVVRRLSSGYRLFAEEWDAENSRVDCEAATGERAVYLHSVRQRIRWDVERLMQIIASCERSGAAFTTDTVQEIFFRRTGADQVAVFMRENIRRLRAVGRMRTAETYETTLKSFMRFRNGEDIPLGAVDSDLMLAYEGYLKKEGVSKNSSSFYMRNLRAVYNRAVEKDLTVQRNPFRHVYTGIDKTVKRAVTLKDIRRIRDLELPLSSSLDYARDLFLFSFYTRGMSFVDMAYLERSSLSGNVLSYRRKKTGQQLFIRWEKCMQHIVDKYAAEAGPVYLLPIIKRSDEDGRRQYITASHLVNRRLRQIGASLGLCAPLTMYVARHAWASIAKSKNIPISVISEGMGHDSEATTQIYLASLDTAMVDRANKRILELL